MALTSSEDIKGRSDKHQGSAGKCFDSCQHLLREGAKNTLRGGVCGLARPSAAHVYPPHLLASPTTPTPFLISLVYTPPFPRLVIQTPSISKVSHPDPPNLKSVYVSHDISQHLKQV